MLLLLMACILMLSLTFLIGGLTLDMLERIFGKKIRADLMGIFLLGILFSACYFNILSFWWPVNYLVLIPLAGIAAVWIFLNKEKTISLAESIRGAIRDLTQPSHLLITLLVFLVTAAYCILPPLHPDSLGYHHLTVLWYEKYKVVPGLANLHGRFAFNPVSFIIEAAWSFTGLAGRSLYPLNMLLGGLFFCWLLKRLFRNMDSVSGLLYLFALAFSFRFFLVNLSSPASDMLVYICILYPILLLVERIVSKEITLSTTIVPVLIILFSITAKLTSFTAFLLLPFLYYWLPKKDKGLPLFGKIAGICLFLYIPWLMRNYIMSGYLLFPYGRPDIFHPDWKASPNLLKYENYYIHNYPTHIPYHPFWHSSIPRVQTLLTWFSFYIQAHQTIDAILIVLGFISPLFWLLPYARTKKVDLRVLTVWLVAFAGIWINLSISMVFRFFVPVTMISILLPLLAWADSLRRWPQTGFFRPRLLVAALFLLIAINYLVGAVNRLPINDRRIAAWWLSPLREPDFVPGKDTASFSYTYLGGGRKLYIGSPQHHCVNADLPCMPVYYGKIEMRGERLDQGFRMTDDKILQLYPFILSDSLTPLDLW